jgi:hypothetical protein
MKATVVTSLVAALLINAAAGLAWDHYTQRLLAHYHPQGSSELVAHR